MSAGQRFHYRAATGTGEIVEGIGDARSRDGLLRQLHRRQLYPIAVEVVATATRPGRGGRMRRSQAVTVWARNVAILLRAAVPLDRALAVTAEQAGHEGLAGALQRVRRSVREGAAVADALEAHPSFFPPVVSSMIAAGEASGALEVAFDQLASYLEESEELRTQVRSALVYPALMATVAALGVSVLLLLVVPRFATILENIGGTLPVSTLALVWMSDALQRTWWLWLGAGLAAGVAIRSWLARPEHRRRWHEWRLTWPVVGDIERKLATARFARTVGMMLGSGASLVPAMRVGRASIPNLAMAAAVDGAADAVAAGERLAASLAGTLSPLAVQMLAIGEESGRLEDLCLRTAETYDREVRRTLRNAVGMIEPAMILVFGVLVGFVALAMLQAIYGMNTTTL